MRLPFVSRRRHDAEIAGVEDKRRRLARWLADEKGVTKGLTDELAAVSIFNACLIEDLTTLRAQLTDGVVGEWRTQALTEKNRADALQRRLDDAMGLNTSQVKAGRDWQSTRTDGGRKQAIL